jgi:hypothetical protein
MVSLVQRPLILSAKFMIKGLRNLVVSVHGIFINQLWFGIHNKYILWYLLILCVNQ